MALVMHYLGSTLGQMVIQIWKILKQTFMSVMSPRSPTGLIGMNQPNLEHNYQFGKMSQCEKKPISFVTIETNQSNKVYF